MDDSDQLEHVVGLSKTGIGFQHSELAGSQILYTVENESNRWFCERVPLTVGPFSLAGRSERVPDQEAAYSWVENDWVQHRNFLRWVRYMGQYPPPA
ncbi:hypothetical protein NLB33_27090 [Mycolicibacterium smegmatis]|uniref:hypothetical protein n=1 Tax=Mycolicibacterium smegmatis TaxID=1772 RepID=UPI0020A559F4|nr:hypothetical protein [Mycolicibacterium smegmatis]MCP2626514.1 hypothetical protein [Mycolicibacterium smegmatis]